VIMAVAQRCLGAQPAGVGGWTLHFELYEGETTPRAINAAMEQWIRKLPEQYLWSYNRYKGTETVNI
jgi:hypothetical protein